MEIWRSVNQIESQRNEKNEVLVHSSSSSTAIAGSVLWKQHLSLQWNAAEFNKRTEFTRRSLVKLFVMKTVCAKDNYKNTENQVDKIILISFDFCRENLLAIRVRVALVCVFDYGY